MAKDKRVEEAYRLEGQRRMKLRKKTRIQKIVNKVRRITTKCRGCGEDPYCYCGDGTPYSY